MKKRKILVIFLVTLLAFSFITETSFACVSSYPYYLNYLNCSNNYSNPVKYCIDYYPNYGSNSCTSYYGCTGYTRLQSVSRSGYNFLYWCTTPSGGGSRYYAGCDYYLNCNVKLYAIWQCNTPVYNYNYNSSCYSSPLGNLPGCNPPGVYTVYTYCNGVPVSSYTYYDYYG